MEALADALLGNPRVFYGRWYLVVSVETQTLARIMEDRKNKRHGAIIRNEASRTQESQEGCENSALTVGSLHPFPAMSNAQQLGSRVGKERRYILPCSLTGPSLNCSVMVPAALELILLRGLQLTTESLMLILPDTMQSQSETYILWHSQRFQYLLRWPELLLGRAYFATHSKAIWF